MKITNYAYRPREEYPKVEYSQAKVYVSVKAFFDEEGYLRPYEIVWEDGSAYKIDRVLEMRPAPALKAGGQGDRYTILVKGRQTYLFFERSTSLSESTLGRWFVERRS